MTVWDRLFDRAGRFLTTRGHGFLNPEDYTMKAFRRAIVLDKPADGLRAPDRGGGR